MTDQGNGFGDGRLVSANGAVPARRGIDQNAHAMMLYDAGKKSIVVAVLLLIFF